jgi:phosphotransferase system  glucose/maltose/N-acetylglucosamine-specific IIC component
MSASFSDDLLNFSPGLIFLLLCAMVVIGLVAYQQGGAMISAVIGWK